MEERLPLSLLEACGSTDENCMPNVSLFRVASDIPDTCRRFMYYVAQRRGSFRRWLTSLCKRTLQYPEWLKLIEKSLGTKLPPRKTLEKLRTTLGQKVILCSPSISVSFGSINPYPTAFPYGNGMVLHFYQQQESSTTKTVHKVINKGLKTYV